MFNDVYLEGIALTTGKTYKANASFTWTFDDDGKVKQWKNQGDFHALEAAFL